MGELIRAPAARNVLNRGKDRPLCHILIVCDACRQARAAESMHSVRRVLHGGRMRVSNPFFLAIVLLLTSFVTGCASVPMASMDEDTKAKSFAVRTDKSNIYVYRNETIGGAIPVTVALNGKLAGQDRKSVV